MICPDCGHDMWVEREEVARMHNTILYDYSANCDLCGYTDFAGPDDYRDAVDLEADRAADDAIEDALYDAHDW